MKTRIILFLFCVSPFFLFSQSALFTKRVTTFTASSFHNIAPTSDTGAVFCADANDSVSGFNYGYLVRLDKTGATQWVKTWQRSAYAVNMGDGCNSVIQTGDHGFAIASVFYSSPNPSFIGTYSIRLMKTDSNGNFQWVKSYSGLGSAASYCVQQTSDLGYIISGTTVDTVSGNRYNYLMKADSTGTMEWARRYADQSLTGQIFHTVRQTSDGGYVACGSSYSGACIVKTNNLGVISWSKIINPFGGDILLDIRQTADGGYVACGFGYPSFPLVRLSSNGTILWIKMYTDVNNAVLPAYNLLETSTGFTVLCASSGSYALMRLDTAGHVTWTNLLRATADVTGSGTLERMPGNGYVLGAYWYGPNATGGVSVVRTNGAGFSQCEDSSIVLTESAYPYTTGTNYGSSAISGAQNAVMNLSAASLADTLYCQSEITAYNGPDASDAFSVYPNPVSGLLNIELKPHAGEYPALQLMSISGKIIAEEKAVNRPSYTIDLSRLDNGVYLIFLVRADGFVSARKIVVQH